MPDDNLLKVSIIIPSYQRGHRIADTLNSVLRQTRRADEILVVNDGGNLSLSEYLQHHYPQIRVLNVPHGGAATARNRGAAAATGEVLIFFDDDDLMEPHAVETLLDLFRQFPEADAAFTDHRLEDRRSGFRIENHHRELPAFRRLASVPVLRSHGTDRVYGSELFYALLRGNLLQQPWAIRRSTFFAIGGYTDGLASSNDWDLYLRLTRAVPVALSDRVCSTHVIERDKSHLTLLPDQEERHIWVMRQTLQRLRWHEFSSKWLLRRRIGLCSKSLGDRIDPGNRRLAWSHYWQSLCWWPFDPVVVVRALVLWPAQALWHRRTAFRQIPLSENP